MDSLGVVGCRCTRWWFVGEQVFDVVCRSGGRVVQLKIPKVITSLDKVHVGRFNGDELATVLIFCFGSGGQGGVNVRGSVAFEDNLIDALR